MTEVARRSTALTGLVLAGGRSRRMGQDKAALLLDGRTYLERVCSAVAAVADAVVVIGATTALLPPGVGHVTDEALGLPLGGLGPGAAVRSFVRQREKCVLLLAADMPLIQQDALSWLIGEWGQAQHGLVCELDGELQPTAMVVTADDVEATLSDDPSPSLRSLCREMRVAQWPQRFGHQLQNVNTPSDRAALSEPTLG